MKKFDLNACGVVEMSQQEMLNVDGGNIFKDAWNAICDAAEAVYGAISEVAEATHVMKRLLFIQFIMCPFFLSSQVKVSGQVFDKVTGETIPNVVVYTNHERKITLTDDNGHYNFEVGLHEPVYFQQLAYNFLEVQSDSLLNMPNVFLTRNIIELSEVVISPLNAQNILNEAFKNLTLHLQKKKSTPYLLHLEEYSSSGGERDAHALINITLNRINNLSGFCYWDFDLIQFDRTKMINEVDFYWNKKPVSYAILPRKFGKYSTGDFIFELQNTNEEQFTIKVSPKYLDKKNCLYRLYTINKRDTVLAEVYLQSYANVAELTLKKDWQITNYFAKAIFAQEKKSDSYYLKEYIQAGNCKILLDHPYDISFNETIFALKGKSVHQTNTSKKIKPYNYILFTTDFPNTPGFWKQYINR